MKRFLTVTLGLVALTLALASTAQAAIVTITPTTTAAFTTVKAGDRVVLSGVFTLPLRPKPANISGVEIVQTPNTHVAMLYPTMGASNVVITGGSYGGVRFDNVNGLTVKGGLYKGPEPADGFGLFINGGKNINVSGADFENFKTGLVLNKVEGFTVISNGFARMRSDGMTIGESRKGIIRGNLCHGTRIVSAEHPDCAQLFSRPTSPPTADILIEGNTVVGKTQGLAGFNHVRNGVDDGGFDRIVIRHNVIIGAYPHGIALNSARDSRVYENTVQTYPGSAYRASINVGTTPTCGNSVAAGAGKPGYVEQPC